MDTGTLLSAIIAIDNLLLLSQRTSIGTERTLEIKRSFFSLLKEYGLEAHFNTNIIGIFNQDAYLVLTHATKANWLIP